MEKANKAIVIIFNILLVFVVVFTITFTLMYREQFYLSQFAKHGVGDATGFSDGQLQMIVSHLLKYLRGDINNLQFFIDGEGIFSRQALFHMHDVREVMVFIQQMAYFLFIITIGLGIYIIVKFKGMKEYFFRYFVINFIVFVSLVIIIALIAIIDFDFAFRAFHRILFWDEVKFNNSFFSSISNYHEAPGVDNRLLIKLLPEPFFMEFAIIVVVATILIFVLIGLFLYNNKRKEQIEEK